MTVLNAKTRILVPLDIDQFLFDYKHSKFIECNKIYAQEALHRMGPSYKIDEENNLKVKNGLKYVKSVLEGYKKTYWLAAGSLLGNKFFNYSLIFL